jgi:hypothetical protein
MAGCGDSGTEKESVTSITLKYNGSTIPDNSLAVSLEDGPLTFTAEVKTTGAASEDFTLASSNTAIATVSGKTVSLLAVGQTTITGTAVGNTAKEHAITLIIEEEQTSGVSAPYNITNNFAQDSSTGFLVQWHNDDDVGEQKLQIVTETGGFGNATTIPVRGKRFSTSGDVGTFASRRIFRAEVTGLTPNTSYKYRFGNMGAWSKTFYHLTSTGSAGDFNFTVVADPQSGAHAEMRAALVAADAFDQDSRFYLMAGDLVDEIGKIPAEIVSYTDTANEFNAYRPIIATQGNHDTYYDNGTDNQYRFGEATIFNAFITFPDNGWDIHADKANRSQSYYFYYNNVLFIILNTMATSNNAGTASPNHTKQAEWLKEVLGNDRTNGLSRYTIVMTHISPFSGRSSERYLTPGVRSAYGKIFSDYEVDIVFAGHDHLYGASNPIKIGTNYALSALDFAPTPGGTIYSIVGTTGPKFYTLDSDTWVPQYFLTRSDNITPGMFVNVKVTAEKLTVTAKSLTGTFEHKYEVAAKQ